MKKEEMVKMLVKLQILCIRHVERNTNLRLYTHRDMDRILMNGKMTCTYGDAVINLESNIFKYCKTSSYLMDEISKLKTIIEESDIKNLRFGLEPQLKFSKEESILDTAVLKYRFYMINEMVGIKDASAILGIRDTTIKQACQQERLLNTKKIGKNWMVHLPECMSYWNIEDNDENHLYHNFKY